MTATGPAARLAAFRAAFPRRPLRVAPPGSSRFALARALFGAPLVLLGIALWIVAADLPLLVTDTPLALSGQAIGFAEQYLGPGSQCRSMATVITTCELELRARAPDGLWQSRSIRYSHLFGRPGSLADLRIMGLPAAPHWLTVDAALDRLANRVLTLLGILGGAVAFAVRMARGTIAAWRVARRLRTALSGQVLTPVALRVVQGVKGIALHRADTDAPLAWRPPRGEAALLALAPGQVLGVAAAEGGWVLPLDRRLRWVTLTRAERAALRQALPAAPR